MGHEKGKGLGKYGQGLVAPVEASKQRGRRGLGLRLEGLEASSNMTWDSNQEVRLYCVLFSVFVRDILPLPSVNCQLGIT